MAIEHRVITDPEIHEPKGVSTAAANTAYVANGTGSGAWQKLPLNGIAGVSGLGTTNQTLVTLSSGSVALKWHNAHGAIYFNNIPSPFTVTYPSVYTKVSPTTTGSGVGKEFNELSTARLTYLGDTTRSCEVTAEINLTQSTGSDKDIRLAIYKNGTIVPASEVIETMITANRSVLVSTVRTQVVTNDYFEVFVKNDGASGDLVLTGFKLSATAELI